MDSNRILLLSMRNVHQNPAYTGWYEMEDVVRSMGDVDVAPIRHYHGSREFEFGRKIHQGLRTLGAKPRAAFLAAPLPSLAEIESRYELVLLVGAGPFDLFELRSVGQSLQHADKVAAWLVEVWPSTVAKRATILEPSDICDQIYFSAGAELMKSVWDKTPVDALPAGIDVLANPIVPLDGKRPIMAFNPGRRSDAQHEVLLEASEQLDRPYLFDTLHGGVFADRFSHRAQYLRLCRFSDVVVANYARFNEPEIIGHVRYASARPTEASVAGSLIVGQQPSLVGAQAGWISDLVRAELSLEPDLDDFLAILKDTERIRAARLENQLVAARRLDWAYHWRRLLKDLGVAEPHGVQIRIDKLEKRAEMLTRLR